VVVQKDQLGFGFTVCGERIKLVQNVRPGQNRLEPTRTFLHVFSNASWTICHMSLTSLHAGGAAVKAGVHEGDRIIKVTPRFKLLPRSECSSLFLIFSPSLHLSLSGQWLAGVVHVSSGSGEAHQV
jgi:hypothetical protein